MLHQLHKTAAPEAELLGDLTPLLERIGSPEGIAAIGGVQEPLAATKTSTPAALRTFLQEYQAQILRPIELPAIRRAYACAERNELRELIAFDQSLATMPVLEKFAPASRIVGLAQLQRLRPLRDQRLVQRYLAAVEEGVANGWHTVTFGIMLAVYSLPLRQGLIGYAQRTTRGFVQSAARALGLSETEFNPLLEEFARTIPAAVEPLLATAIKA